MKYVKLITLITVIAGFVVFNGCGGSGGDDPSVREINTGILTSKTWTVNTVTVPAGTATEGSAWNNFTVTFNPTNMTTTNHPTGAEVVWPTGITWTFKDDEARVIVRGDGVDMTINTISESSLVLTFTMPDNTQIAGRTAGLGGQYTFNLR
ncbi:MAG: hypothetical protein JJU28_16150 [Cyclobacteriaceae bacterium]|nr:hypothetical protein [Cyclobacteriaceae bacterium]